jgi:hypothetical protein
LNQITADLEPASPPPAPPSSEWVDYYALLELAPFEPDIAKISTRARDLMREARKYQVGPRGAGAQQRLDNLAAATACLLDPAHKRAYDDELQRRYDLPMVAVTSTYQAPVPPTRDVVPVGRVAAGSRLWLTATVALAVIVAGVMALLPNGPDEASRNSSASAPANADVVSSLSVAQAEPVTESRESAASVGHANGEPALENRPLSATHADQHEHDSDAIEEPAEVDEDSLESEFENSPADAPIVERRPSVPRAAEPAIVRGPPRVPPAAAEMPDLDLTPAEVLRELKRLRVRSAAPAVNSADPRLTGWFRAATLVRYARSEFADDRRFQRQLDQEVVALKRVWPQIREFLPAAGR